MQVHIPRTTPGQTSRASISPSKDVVNVNFYANCQPGAGNGCYVDLPLELTQLFIAVSENDDVTLTARVGGPRRAAGRGGADQRRLGQRAAVGRSLLLDHAGVNQVPGYLPPNNADNTPGSTGTGIQRYDFGKDGAARPRWSTPIEGVRRPSRARRPRPPTTPSASAATPSPTTARPWR